MDSLRGIPEHVEPEFGASITSRDEALLALGDAPGLGPPDLCWLQKCPKPTGWGGGKVGQGTVMAARAVQREEDAPN